MLTPVIALALVYFLVVGICRGILRGIRRIEVVNALVHGSTLNDRQTARKAAASETYKITVKVTVSYQSGV